MVRGFAAAGVVLLLPVLGAPVEAAERCDATDGACLLRHYGESRPAATRVGRAGTDTPIDLARALPLDGRMVAARVERSFLSLCNGPCLRTASADPGSEASAFADPAAAAVDEDGPKAAVFAIAAHAGRATETAAAGTAAAGPRTRSLAAVPADRPVDAALETGSAGGGGSRWTITAVVPAARD